MSELTLVILLDAGRHDYPQHMPFVSSLLDKGVYAQKIYNPGGYTERSCFMTGTTPDVSGNMFAMSLMPPGYKRAYWEPKFNIPSNLRDRLCMTEDVNPDTQKGAFYNPDTNETIESVWDVFRENDKSWVFEACLALGIQSWRGETTHGPRAVRIIKQLDNKRPDVAYWQISRIDQEAHKRGAKPDNMKDILRWADGEIKRVYQIAQEQYDKVNLLIFGDHGQTMIKETVDFALEYPGFTFGWDYLYLKSSAAIQFWTFNSSIDHYIKADPKLNQHGKFIESPSSRQGDLIWAANPGVLVNPCHFHDRSDVQASMHGYQLNSPGIDSEKGFALAINGKDTGVIEQADLTDITETLTDLVGVPAPDKNRGTSLFKQIK